jgi:tRNA-dihydrouridine synthase
MMQQTGCQAVMIGRAALSDPWIFRDTHAFLSGAPAPPEPTTAQRLELMTRHFEHLLRIRGERPACLTLRQRVSWYARKLPPCRAFREAMRMVCSAEEFNRLIEAFPGDGSSHAHPPCCETAARSTTLPQVAVSVGES